MCVHLQQAERSWPAKAAVFLLLNFGGHWTPNQPEPQNKQSPVNLVYLCEQLEATLSQVTLPLRKCLILFVCVDFVHSVSLTVHVTFELHAGHAEYRLCWVLFLLTLVCPFPYDSHLLYLGIKYLVNISESLPFITKGVIGSQHRKFRIQLFLRAWWISNWIKVNTALLQPVDK